MRHYFFKCFFYTLLTILYGSLHAGQKSITIFEGNENPKKKVINVNTSQVYHTSLHFLLTTIGRQSIFRMIKSLENQVKPQDFLTIVFDSKDRDSVFEAVKTKVTELPCKVNVMWEEKNLGYWGHAIRNKHNNLPGDFILHCDDDDIYLPGSLDTIRAVCQNKNKLYVFRFRMLGSNVWNEPRIAMSNIGTPCGVIPSAYNLLSTWEPVVGGDCMFYENLAKAIGDNKLVFVDYLIYFVKNSGHGRANLINQLQV
ncbi:glycosyltransferase family 2 protein [Candidatus Dependentiae bacterium]|nr:glycosyltransferase family 2 protein [Candidatus Dependentiae bacterium]